MTTVIRSKCCNAEIREVDVEVPPPPGALLATTSTPPDEWVGRQWVCVGCEAVVGFSYDYGTIDLGLVTDEQLARDGGGEFEVFG